MKKCITKTGAGALGSAMESRNHFKNRVSPKNVRSRKNLLISTAILTFLAVTAQSCCALMPKARTSEVSVKVTPSNAEIYNRYGNLLGTGKVTLHFDCTDEKYAAHTITMKTPGYRPKTEKISNYRYSYSTNFTLDKKVDTDVSVTVSPSNAEIYDSNGDKVGTGSCKLTFDEDDKSNAYYELTLKAPYHYSKTEKVYKSDLSKSFTLSRKPIKTVVVTPAEAEIAVNNDPVGKGRYDVDFENKDKVLLTFSYVGYETASYYLLKSNPEQTVTYQLDKDEAYENSLGGEPAALNANKWVPIKTRKSLTDDEVWLRLISIVRENFDQIEKTDKSSGWIKTFPAVTPYKASDVRTTLEIAPDYSTGELQYKVRLYFEKRKKGSGDEGWERYDRLLKFYKDVIPDLLNSVGGGM